MVRKELSLAGSVGVWAVGSAAGLGWCPPAPSTEITAVIRAQPAAPGEGRDFSALRGSPTLTALYTDSTQKLNHAQREGWHCLTVLTHTLHLRDRLGPFIMLYYCWCS